uniref:Uncharacterized protein n=1 Tax=Oryza barthii TaxID=65489 RepID=A0A0D3G2E4_9ORYZ
MPLLSIGVGTRLGISGKRWRGGERERRWRDRAWRRSSRVVGTVVTGANNLTDTGMGRHYPCPSCPIAIPRDSGDGSRLGHLLLTKAASASTSPRHRCLRLLSHRQKWVCRLLLRALLPPPNSPATMHAARGLLNAAPPSSSRWCHSRMAQLRARVICLSRK